MNFNLFKRGAALLMAAAVMLVVSSESFAQKKNEDIVVGTVEKIDHAAKTIAVKTADGAVRVFKWTKKTTANGINEAAAFTNHEAHVGAHVVVHSVKIAEEDTVKSLKWFGHGTAKVVEGTVRVVGKTGKKVGLAVADGAEEVYDVSEHAVVKTGKGIVAGTKYTAKETKKGVKATVHFVESGGKKFVHFISHHDGDKN